MKFKTPSKISYFICKFLINNSPSFAIRVSPAYMQHIYRIGRRQGNTTRMVDMFVQDFFDTGKCNIYDHHNTRESIKRVFNMVLERLAREHGIDTKDVMIDRNRFIIKRKF